MTEYRVDLEIFAGPLDLLLYLVRKEEVDIYDIPIARITGQYVKYIELLKILDIDMAGDFLVMAATLMEIKSVMLLPRAEVEDGGDDDMLDPRTELVRQLLEYKKFKDAANLLQDSAQQRKERFTRPDAIIAELKGDSEPELDLDQISVWTLLEAFDAIMQATGHYADYDHIQDDTPIDLYQIEILHRLQTEGAMTFERIFQGQNTRLALVGLFLALLELIRSRLVWAEQTSQAPDGIYLRSLTDEPAEQAVQNAIVAQLAPEQEDIHSPTPAQPDKAPIAIQELPPKNKDTATPADHEDNLEPAENTDFEDEN